MNVVGQALKSVLVALLSMPVGTRCLFVLHWVSFGVSYITSHQAYFELFCLQPHKAIFSMQRACA